MTGMKSYTAAMEELAKAGGKRIHGGSWVAFADGGHVSDLALVHRNGDIERAELGFYWQTYKISIRQLATLSGIGCVAVMADPDYREDMSLRAAEPHVNEIVDVGGVLFSTRLRGGDICSNFSSMDMPSEIAKMRAKAIVLRVMPRDEPGLSNAIMIKRTGDGSIKWAYLFPESSKKKVEINTNGLMQDFREQGGNKNKSNYVVRSLLTGKLLEWDAAIKIEGATQDMPAMHIISPSAAEADHRQYMINPKSGGEPVFTFESSGRDDAYRWVTGGMVMTPKHPQYIRVKNKFADWGIVDVASKRMLLPMQFIFASMGEHDDELLNSTLCVLLEIYEPGTNHDDDHLLGLGVYDLRRGKWGLKGDYATIEPVLRRHPDKDGNGGEGVFIATSFGGSRMQYNPADGTVTQLEKAQ